MDQRERPGPDAIRQARSENLKMRERDLAAQLGITEAELLAAHCGDGVVRLEARANDLLTGMEAVGEVMALTRNDSAVHEKIGIYDKVVTGEHAALALGENIDLRIFPTIWTHGFAVEKRDGDEIRRSLQFFDAAGDAVHKVHLRPSSNLSAYQTLVASLQSADQSTAIAVEPPPADMDAEVADTPTDAEALREGWSKLTDVHQFFGMLRKMKLGRRQAVRMVGAEYATQLETGAASLMFERVVTAELPIMCFVGNRGCIQIHSGPVRNIKPMGPWLNVMDETFHLHLRTDHVAETWLVRKPTKDGHVTSLELYDANGRMIIQYFGQRHEGEAERADWRALAENLPRLAAPIAA